MTKIFISYRRQDTKAIAGRILDRLEAKFGRNDVFMDIDAIPPGVDFHDWISNQISTALVVLALIGPNWVNARDEAGNRRLDDPNDFVRLELEAAITRKIPLVPVLIDGALLPRTDELPESLGPLVRRNATFLDVGRDFNLHVGRLIEAIEGHLIGRWVTAAELKKMPLPNREPDNDFREQKGITKIQELQDTITRIYEASNAPPLPPSEYQPLFSLIATEVRERGFATINTAQAVAASANQEGLHIALQDVIFVVNALDEIDPGLDHTRTPAAVAKAYRDWVLSKCHQEGVKLTDDEHTLIQVWFGASQ
ncbi:MAG: toll/interleukin-1 receptor domain-containing protein [Rhodomicrobium sp.]